MKRVRGFGLLELLLALAILGILASIAIPNYQAHVLRANRVEGRALLMDAAARQERYFAQNHRFVRVSGQIDLLGLDALSRSGLYRLEVSAGDGADGGFRLVAVALRRDPECPALTLNALGDRGPDVRCWR
ncbi:hypothetical protein PKB_5227 [Pseudomonas knackmussii B13]|uniref:Prepilin-type N-terminal cleavage/methylation domain-containing protein n=1 Tax=Pseudomonas knackmussii (strain DSM 6978 / CCUG 54928 / LMG 23759 / B13) TaxID=1301098 RepID=A0A024HNB2_PSEKB|nr:hypothetical protein PKB_5227 [Pseudomonas knackmussii B13]